MIQKLPIFQRRHTMHPKMRFPLLLGSVLVGELRPGEPMGITFVCTQQVLGPHMINDCYEKWKYNYA